MPPRMITAPAHLLLAALALQTAGVEARHDPETLACLALNVYHEARGESTTGQLAVAHVTLNRARSPRWPSDPCAVVTERRGGVCQFAWVCKGRRATPELGALARAFVVATAALKGDRPDPTGGATHFLRADHALPDWAKRLRQSAVIGAHRFLRRG